MSAVAIRSESYFFPASSIRRVDLLQMIVTKAFNDAVGPFGPFPRIGEYPPSDDSSVLGIIRNLCKHYSNQVRGLGKFPDFTLSVEEHPEQAGSIKLVATGTP